LTSRSTIFREAVTPIEERARLAKRQSLIFRIRSALLTQNTSKIGCHSFLSRAASMLDVICISMVPTNATLRIVFVAYSTNVIEFRGGRQSRY
jgi:hypothetical protein